MPKEPWKINKPDALEDTRDNQGEHQCFQENHGLLASPTG